MIRKFMAFRADDSENTTIEYALVARGVSIVIFAAVIGIGTQLNTTFRSLSTLLK